MNKVADRIARNVKNLRKRAGLSQAQLAKKAQVSPRYVSQIENGAPNVTVGIVEKIADAMNEPTDKILCLSPTGWTKVTVRMLDQCLGLLKNIRRQIDPL